MVDYFQLPLGGNKQRALLKTVETSGADSAHHAVCGRSLAGIVGSNPARSGRHGCLCLVSVVCCQVEVSASG